MRGEDNKKREGNVNTAGDKQNLSNLGFEGMNYEQRRQPYQNANLNYQQNNNAENGRDLNRNDM